MILVAKINPAIGHNRRTINFESAFVIPDERSIFLIQAVEMMIEAAGEDLVVDQDRRGFHAVPAFEFPNDAAIVFVQAVDVAVRGRKVNSITFD